MISLIGGSTIRDTATHETAPQLCAGFTRSTIYIVNALDKAILYSVDAIPVGSTDRISLGSASLNAGSGTFETFTDMHNTVIIAVKANVSPTQGEVRIFQDGR